MAKEWRTWMHPCPECKRGFLWWITHLREYACDACGWSQEDADD